MTCRPFFLHPSTLFSSFSSLVFSIRFTPLDVYVLCLPFWLFSIHLGTPATVRKRSGLPLALRFCADETH